MGTLILPLPGVFGGIPACSKLELARPRTWWPTIGGIKILVEPVGVGETATPNSKYSRPTNEVWISQILTGP